MMELDWIMEERSSIYQKELESTGNMQWMMVKEKVSCIRVWVHSFSERWNGSCRGSIDSHLIQPMSQTKLVNSLIRGNVLQSKRIEAVMSMVDRLVTLASYLSFPLIRYLSHLSISPYLTTNPQEAFCAT